MRNERELACDASVLQILDEKDYIDYGNTLLNFAEKLACTPFPFTSGLGGNRKQMKRRILNIASYQRPDRIRRLKSTLVFILTSVLLIGFVPFIFTTAADDDRYPVSYTHLDVYKRQDFCQFRRYGGKFQIIFCYFIGDLFQTGKFSF